ncbi:MAG TPA: hypothetical protein VGQ16_05615 [Vicinamibacterales bacterium]|jgi:hypothetical protein|nr:hypothetical protein [Vicinamibacterales bacterium]
MMTSWGMLLFLGAFHGINPGMGWLFAVALGMQENRSAAVWRALLPIGVGHACAVAAAVALGILAGIVLPLHVIRWPIAAILVMLGVQRLVRHRHPRYGSMRIGLVGLTIWSFLVATAHGAGLMVLPVWLRMSATAGGHSAHLHDSPDLASGLAAIAVHSGSYLLVTAAIAWIVFHKLGVGLLRKAWINLDLIWAVALIASGALTLLLPQS